MKKCLALFLVLILLVTMIPIGLTVSAAATTGASVVLSFGPLSTVSVNGANCVAVPVNIIQNTTNIATGKFVIVSDQKLRSVNAKNGDIKDVYIDDFGAPATYGFDYTIGVNAKMTAAANRLHNGAYANIVVSSNYDDNGVTTTGTLATLYFELPAGAVDVSGYTFSLGEETEFTTQEVTHPTVELYTETTALRSIAIQQLPTKTTYLEGKETLNLAGGKVKLTYNNDTTKTIDMTASMVSGFDNTKVGQQTLTVTYGGKTTTFNVTIKAKSLTGISIQQLPTKTTYLVSKETLDVSGGKVRLTYDNGTTETINMTTSMVTGFGNTKVGQKTLTVTYGGKTATFNVTIKANSLTGISIQQLPTKLIYLEGKETLNLAGGKVKLTYDSGTTETIDMTASMVSGFNNIKVGQQTLTVTYGGKTATFDVTVTAVPLSTVPVVLSIGTLTTKTVGGKWCVEVPVNIIQNTTNIATGKFVIVSDQKLRSVNAKNGDIKDVYIDDFGAPATYGFDYTIGVNAKMTADNNKLFNGAYANIVVTSNYDFNGVTTTGTLATLYFELPAGVVDVSGYTFSLGEGTQFTTQEQTHPAVELLKKEIKSVSVQQLPTKQTYLEGKETLNLAGGKVKLTYDNDTTETVDMTAAMVTGFDNTKVGQQTLTVTFDGKTTTFTVTIKAKSLAGIYVQQLPAKTIYLQGKETLDVSGGKVLLAYDNDTTETVDLTAAMLSGFDNAKAGQQTLTVTYGGKNTTFDVAIVDHYFTLKDGVLSLFAYGAWPDYNLFSATPWYDQANQITTVVVDSGVTKIGANSFKELGKLSWIGFGNKDTEIGKYAVNTANQNLHVYAPGDGTVKTYCTENGVDFVGAVETPTLETVNGNSLTVKTVPGLVYSLDGQTWQSSGVFSGLDPVTTYTVYARRVSAPIQEALAPSAPRYVTTTKRTVAAPKAPTVVSHTADSVTLGSDPLYEYSMDGQTWQSVPVFSGLSANVIYRFCCRTKETDTDFASDAGPAVAVALPAAPEVLHTGYSKALVKAVEGFEYSLNNINWQSDPLFKELVDGMEYTVYQRLAQTVGGYQILSAGTKFVTNGTDPTESLELRALPAKLTYLEGKDLLELTGARLFNCHDDWTEEEVTITAAMVSGFDNTKVGQQTLTVTYGGKTTTFMVTIEAAAINGDANGDRLVDTDDLVHLKKYLAGLLEKTNYSAGADANRDGEIDTTDLVLVKKYLAGLIDTFA